jgi:hypothetical protein
VSSYCAISLPLSLSRESSLERSLELLACVTRDKFHSNQSKGGSGGKFSREELCEAPNCRFKWENVLGKVLAGVFGLTHPSSHTESNSSGRFILVY